MTVAKGLICWISILTSIFMLASGRSFIIAVVLRYMKDVSPLEKVAKKTRNTSEANVRVAGSRNAR